MFDEVRAVPKQTKFNRKKEKVKDIPKPIRKFVKERDKQCCVVCGSPRSLQLHHIVTKGRYDARLYKFENVHDPKNLATVCVFCHKEIHANPEAMRAMLEWQKFKFGEIRRFADESPQAHS
jgi:5-methylcytosine-specific restriction endonuclease McrA